MTVGARRYEGSILSSRPQYVAGPLRNILNYLVDREGVLLVELRKQGVTEERECRLDEVRHLLVWIASNIAQDASTQLNFYKTIGREKGRKR